MHGRGRSEYKALQRDPKVAAGLAKKAEQWYTLTAQIQGDNALVLTDKLLTVNPDPLYLWNERRRHSLDWDTESTLTAVALRNNPKAYGAWFHRKWCLVHLVMVPSGSGHRSSVLRQELALTVQFLERDERNFHCWNYRRFVVSLLLAGGPNNGAWDLSDSDTIMLMGAQMVFDASAASSIQGGEEKDDLEVTEKEDWITHEWDFTQTKIQQNFSNFSAFHYRSKLYPLQKKSNKILQGELELVENAIFTEPDDQTAWWYQSFLLGQPTTTSEEEKAAWDQHMSNLQELAQEVPRSKWVVLGLLNCGRALGTETETLLQYCQTLMELDPDRLGRYQSLVRQISRTAPSS